MSILQLRRLMRRATQAEQEAGTSGVVVVTPSVQQFHPSAAKFWAFVTVSGGTPTLTTAYNVASITDTAVGQLTVTLTTAFSSANWACVATTGGGAVSFAEVTDASRSTSATKVNAFDAAGSFVDPGTYSVAGFGDQ